MSQILYALVLVQGTSLSFAPGYTTTAECLQQYRGPNVACFPYEPDGQTWTGFFKLPDGSIRNVGKIPSEAECQRYIGAFKSDIPAACRQRATPVTCVVSCVKPLEPPPPLPPPPAAKPEPPPKVEEPKPDPASVTPSVREVPINYRSGQTCQVGWSPKQCTAYRVADEVRIDGKQYTRVAGLAWTPVTEVPTASREDQPAPPPEPPKQRTAERRTRQPQPQQFDPLGEFIAVVMSPIRFATYPARRDW
jgi:hypothetical protein